MPGAADAAFVRRHTRPGRAALVPELQLYLAAEVVPLWERTEQRQGSPQPPPFWAFAWPGSQVLARWILDHPEVVRAQRVLDFAAGGGLAALAAVLAGASFVRASDVDPLASTAQRLNAELNGLQQLHVVCADLVGSSLAELGVEVVLAGDVCYDRQQSPRITAWLHRLASEGATVLLADPGRAYAPTQHVELLATVEVPTLVDLESTASRPTCLFHLQKP